MSTPAISVIMGVYNGAEYLEEAISSILNQTFTDFECIIVDDASTDTNVAKILTRFAKEDPRVQILTNAENKERSFSRNRALYAAKAPYIAIMDSDDVCDPERLAKQYAFMEANPHVSLCGAEMESYETSTRIKYKYTNENIRAYTFFNCPFSHPTVIMHKEPIMHYTKGYNEAIVYAEDHDLFSRLIKHTDIVFANMPEVLLRWRSHPSRKRTTYHTLLQEGVEELSLRQQQELGIASPNKCMHTMLRSAKRAKDPQELHQCGQWMHEILHANAQKHIYPHEAFLNECHFRWAKLCYRSLPALPKAWNIYKEYRPKSTSLLNEVIKALVKTACKRTNALQKRLSRQLLRQNTPIAK